MESNVYITEACANVITSIKAWRIDIYKDEIFYCTVFGKTKGEVEINAKLIVAAPDLLECCLTTKEIYESQCINEDVIIGGKQYERLIETIKKATK